MPSAVPQTPRRMGIGRGSRTSLENDVTRSSASAEIGLQQRDCSSETNGHLEIFRGFQTGSGMAVSRTSHEAPYVPNPAKSSLTTRMTSRVSDLMYTVSERAHEVDGKLVGLILNRGRNINTARTVHPEHERSWFYDHFGSGDRMQLENSSKQEPYTPEVAKIEEEQRGPGKVEKTLALHSTNSLAGHGSQDRREAAFARFLKPALLQAEADRKMENTVDQDSGAASQFIIPMCSQAWSPREPQATPATEDENLMRTTVSSELSNGNGMYGSEERNPEYDDPQSYSEIRVSQAVKTTEERISEQAISIPTPSVRSVEIRQSESTMSPLPTAPLRNPVTITPMPDLGAIETTTIGNGTSWKSCAKISHDNSSVRGATRMNHLNARAAHGAQQQECIRKKRRYAVGEWKSFLVKNFSLCDENSFAIWITESEGSPDLEERLANIDTKKLNRLSWHTLGGAAMLKRGEKYLRVMVVDLRHSEATVEDVDSGDKMRVTLTDLFSLPQALKSIPPLALRVLVESQRITNSERFEIALKLAKDHQTVTDGCALTWDFVPKFVFRLPGCRALASSNDTISAHWRRNSFYNSASKQHLYSDLPWVLLPAAGTIRKQCLVTHVEGSTVYLTWDDLHNFVLEPASEDLPLRCEVGRLCLVFSGSDPCTEMRCCIEALQDEVAWVRWLDCGALFEVATQFLCPLPARLIYPPGAVKATLANFQSWDLESAGDNLPNVLLASVNLQIFFLDSKAVPSVIIFTENFTEVKLENLEKLRSLRENDAIDVLADDPGCRDSEEMKMEPRDAVVVGISAFSQVWVVPKESMGVLEEMEARLSRSSPADLRECDPGTPCAVMHEGILRRGVVRLRIGKRFLVRLMDRASEISASRVFELPEEFREIPTPCQCIGLCREQFQDAHFGRFISALKRNPEVTLISTSTAVGTSPIGVNGTGHANNRANDPDSPPEYFLITPGGEDIMTAYQIRDQPR